MTVRARRKIIGDYWEHHFSIPVVHTDAGAQSNYVMKLNVVRGPGTNVAGTIYLNDGCYNWPYDIRFVASDERSLLPFWRSEFDDTDGTWYVQVDSLPADGSQAVFIYFGLPGAQDKSDIASIAESEFGEDFRVQNALSPKWTPTGSIIDYNVGLNNQQIDLAIDVTLAGDPTAYEAWPDMCVDSAGTVYCVYRNGPSDEHNYDPLGYVCIRKSTDHGRTWGSEIVVADEGGGIDDRNPSIACIQHEGADRLIVFYNYLTSSTPGTARAFVKYSDNAGVDWSSKYALDAGLTRATFCKPIRLSNGKVLGGIYYNYSLYMFESSDDGETWTKIATITSGTKEIAEQQIIEVKTGGVYAGKIYMICRNQTTPYKLQKFWSTDWGYTWTTHEDIEDVVYDNWAVPPSNLLRLADDSILLVMSQNYGIRAYRSQDECQTWQKIGYLYRPSSSNIARAYAKVVIMANGMMGMVWCSNQSDPGTSDVYFSDFLHPSEWDTGLEFYQKSTANNYLEGVASLGPNVAIEARARWISGSAGCASVNWGFGYYHEATYDTNGVRMERRTTDQYYLITCNNSGRALQTSGITRDANFHLFTIKYVTGRCQLYQDAVKVDGDLTTYIPSIALPVVIGPTSNASYLFGHYEWLFVRKCVDPEPVWDTPGTEDLGGGVL